MSKIKKLYDKEEKTLLIFEIICMIVLMKKLPSPKEPIMRVFETRTDSVVSKNKENPP